MPAPRLPPTTTPDPAVDRATLQGRLERFRQRWEAREGLEKQQAQEFLRELLACYGHATGEHDVGRTCWQTPEVCPNDKTVAIATADDAVLGVLLSRPFAAWIVRWGGTLKADLHFTPTTVFETFPFPDDLTGDAGSEIAAATVALVERRSQLCLDPEAPVGLTTLYNRVDDGAHRDLVTLHVALDRAVLRAYGWPLALAQRTDGVEDDLLDRLYARNLAIAAGEVPGYEAFPLAPPPTPDPTGSLF